MIKKTISDRNITVSVLLFFALALLIIGMVLRTRIGMFLQSYTENQVRKQAETFALLMAEKLDTELENLEYIADKLESSLDDMDDIMPRIYNEPGIRQGLLSIDGRAVYGDSLDFMVYDGIQSSFRGKKVITYVENKGILFTCPVFNGSNIRYVLYRLCPGDALEEYLASEIYDDLGKFCVATRDGSIVVPFYNSSEEDLRWYLSDDIQSKYTSMHLEMEVSIAAVKTFSTDRGDMLLFESEIPGTDYLVSGYVPKSVAAEGIGSITLLVSWVFGMLMLLVMIGAFYLTRASIKIRESNELREAKALAEEASQAKSDFLANMSHEIRTPINAILGMNEMILRESRDDEITTYASNIKTAGNSLLGIINDILDFSKIESGKVEIIPVEYDMASFINDLVNMIKTRANDKGLQLQLDFDHQLPSGLYGDEVRIKQIITNLLTNAVKYTEKGTVTLGIQYKYAGVDADSIVLKVSVKDTGVGIRPEDIEKLFSKFERLEEKRNRSIEGTGLGLSISENLLELMGSKLEVESVYGEGSTFSFALVQKVTAWEPIGNYEEVCREHIEDREKYREKFTAPDARILVVDDNPMNLMVFKNLVKKTEVRTECAESGKEGILLSKKTKYDMIFLDHMMPEKDGIETLQEIRADADNPNAYTPAVCLTANAISGARDRYINAGFDDYISKPIDPDKLEDMMLEFLPKQMIRIIQENEEDKNSENGSSDKTGQELFAVLKDSPINTVIGIKNNGTADVYLSMLKFFYETIDDRVSELKRLYETGDIENYTIKVHALKSSARIIGAADFGEEAQRLENAGKDGDIDYIREHEERFIEEYLHFKDILSGLFHDETAVGQETGRPMADPRMMKEFYERLRPAVLDMNCDRLDELFEEMDAYRIPAEEEEKYRSLKEAGSYFDYDKMKELLD